jgi:hypothetical protein
VQCNYGKFKSLCVREFPVFVFKREQTVLARQQVLIHWLLIDIDFNKTREKWAPLVFISVNTRQQERYTGPPEMGATPFKECLRALHVLTVLWRSVEARIQSFPFWNIRRKFRFN